MRHAGLLVLLATLVAGGLPACSRAHTRACPPPPCTTPASPCYPGDDVPPPVGTEAADRVAALVVRAYDVRDILDAMPVIELVGPEGSRVVPNQEAWTQGVLAELDGAERAAAEIHATETGSLVVKAPPRVQARVESLLAGYRDELRSRQAEGPPFGPPPRPAAR